MAEASTAVKASQDAMAASMQSAMSVFQQFDAIEKINIKTAQDLADAQKALTAARASGAFTSEELAAKEAIVSAAMSKVGKDTKAAGAAMNAFTSNSRTMYSVSALITDAMTGQYSRMRREVAALANETGLMARAFRSVIGPAGATAAAIGLVSVALVKGAEQSSKFADSLIATGNYAGTTEGEMSDLAQSIAGGSITIGDARDAVLQFAESGRFTHDQLQSAAEAAAAFATVANVSMDKAVQAIVRIQENPVEALQKLNEQYHFLNQTQLDAVASLVKQGETTKAVSLAIDDFGNVMHQRAMEAVADVGYMERAWEGLKAVISDTVNWMEQAGRKVTLQQQLQEADHDLQLIRDHGETVGRMIIGMEATGSKLFSNPANYTVDKLTAKVNGLKAAIAAADKQAQAQGAATQANTTTKPHGGTGSGAEMSALEQQFQEQEARAHASYDQMKQDAADFWNEQATDSKNSAAVQAEAWQKYTQIRHELDGQTLRLSEEDERKGEESARKSAEAAKRDAEGVARAKAEANREIYQEIQKEAAARRASDMAAIEGARQVALARIAAARQQAQAGYDAGNITAAELLQVEQQLAQKKLELETRYWQQKMALDQGDVAAQMRDMSSILADKQKVNQAMAANEDKFIKESELKWKQYSQRVAGAFQNAMNSMLFQGQHLRQGLASVAESISETFMEAVVNKPLQAFIAGEGEKLAAAIGFGSQKTAQEETQRAINASADIADKSAAALRAAGLAGAQGVASFAAAPWPIDIGAPAFGAAMFAEAAAFGSIASAAGGWERVPADGMMTKLHEDEMVLPAHIAEPMRQMARNGAGGGGDVHHHHYTIQAYDRRGLADFVARNGIELGNGLARLVRNGHRA